MSTPTPTTTALAVPNKVSLTSVQFNSLSPTDIVTSLRRLVQDLLSAEKTLNALIAVVATPQEDNQTLPHVLATVNGLDPDHTVTGLAIGQVLRAISATDAAFQRLALGDLAGFDINDPAQNQLIQFIDGYWTNVNVDEVADQTVGQTIGNGIAIYAGKDTPKLLFKSLSVDTDTMTITDDGEGNITLSSLGGSGPSTDAYPASFGFAGIL